MDIPRCNGKCVTQHYAKTACEFYLKAQACRESFQATLEVQLYESTTTQGSRIERKKKKQEKEKCELLVEEVI